MLFQYSLETKKEKEYHRPAGFKNVYIVTVCNMGWLGLGLGEDRCPLSFLSEGNLMTPFPRTVSILSTQQAS